ncbi:hypothetical protein PG984_009943 [Apiospora sp. TS-2023a]
MRSTRRSPMGTEPKREFHQATIIADKMAAIRTNVRDTLYASQDRTAEQANLSRQDAGEFRIGDLVWISTKYIDTGRPTPKLDDL